MFCSPPLDTWWVCSVLLYNWQTYRKSTGIQILQVFGAVLAGITGLYICGLTHLYIILNFYLHKPASVLAVIGTGLIPFIPTDLISAVIATLSSVLHTAYPEKVRFTNYS